jgi:hypothetical protein
LKSIVAPSAVGSRDASGAVTRDSSALALPPAAFRRRRQLVADDDRPLQRHPAIRRRDGAEVVRTWPHRHPPGDVDLEVYCDLGGVRDQWQGGVVQAEEIRPGAKPVYEAGAVPAGAGQVDQAGRFDPRIGDRAADPHDRTVPDGRQLQRYLVAQSLSTQEKSGCRVAAAVGARGAAEGSDARRGVPLVGPDQGRGQVSDGGVVLRVDGEIAAHPGAGVDRGQEQLHSALPSVSDAV